jgi:hypothetical protein
MRILLVMLLAAIQAGNPAPDAPTATIANGQVRAVIQLPDAKAGYYRGARFDWSGQVSSLTWKGHEYFGQWNDAYDPTLHDAIQGPVEEFLSSDNSAPGYAEAAAGGTFVRIGIGTLRKPAGEKELQRFGRYEIVDGGKWTTKPGKDRITFVHELKDGTGYAYTYTKTLRLSGDQLIIEHELKNTGTKPIAQLLYPRSQDDQPGQRRPLSVRAEGGAPVERDGGGARPRDRHRPPVRSEGERLHRGRGLRDDGVGQRLRDGEPDHRGRRARRRNPAAVEAVLLVGLPDGLPRALRRRERRARPHHLVGDHARVGRNTTLSRSVARPDPLWRAMRPFCGRPSCGPGFAAAAACLRMLPERGRMARSPS